jgi:hypothetical protein
MADILAERQEIAGKLDAGKAELAFTYQQQIVQTLLA